MNRPTRRRDFLHAAAIAAVWPSIAAADIRRDRSKTLVFVHSPLLGPNFWQPAASELRQRGWRCVVPMVDRIEGTIPAWRSWPQRLSRASGAAPGAIVVGHSGAGLLLPALARELQAHALIYVDAQIPPSTGSVPPAEPKFLTFIRSLPLVDGRLPRWSEWWGRDVLSAAIPDPEARARFRDDEPVLTPEWFDDGVAVPPWSDLPSAYIQTSSSYSEQAQTAQARQWPVVTIQGTHLHAYVAPGEIADAIERVVQSLTENPQPESHDQPH